MIHLLIKINQIRIRIRAWINNYIYRQTSNIRRTSLGNKIVDHSDVVGTSPVGAAPTTSSSSTSHLASMDWAKTTATLDEKHLNFGIWCVLYWRFYGTSKPLKLEHSWLTKFHRNPWMCLLIHALISVDLCWIPHDMSSGTLTWEQLLS